MAHGKSLSEASPSPGLQGSLPSEASESSMEQAQELEFRRLPLPGCLYQHKADFKDLLRPIVLAEALLLQGNWIKSSQA